MDPFQSRKVPRVHRATLTYGKTCSLALKLGVLFMVTVFTTFQVGINLHFLVRQQQNGFVEASIPPSSLRRWRSHTHLAPSNSSTRTNATVGKLTTQPIHGRLLYVGVVSAPSHMAIRKQLRSKFVSGVRDAFGDGSVRVEFVIGHTSKHMRCIGKSASDSENGDSINRSKLEKEIWSESQRFGDIARIPLPEAYENLPDKTLLLFEKGMRGGYKFIMKIDDDRILNLMPILEYIRTVSDPMILWYGGRAYHATLQRDTQLGMRGMFSTYFSGPSYLLSWEVAWYITKVDMSHSASYLRYGSSSEDVDMGIWVEYVKNRTGKPVTYYAIPVATDPNDSLEGCICIWEWRSLCFRITSGERIVARSQQYRLVELHTDRPTPFVFGANGTLQLKGSRDDCLAIIEQVSGHGSKLGVVGCQSEAVNRQFLFCDDLTLRLKSQPHMCIGMDRGRLTNVSVLTLEHCNHNRMQRFNIASFNASTLRCPEGRKLETQTFPSSDVVKTVARMGSVASGNECLLYLGILSFPANFNRRNEVRRAYLQALRQHDGMHADFFVGHEQFWEQAQGSLATPRQFSLEMRLQAESETHHDVNRVPLVDVHAHLQDKALMVFRHGLDLGCSFVAKVTDDRNVDVSSLVHFLGSGCWQNLCYAGEVLQSHAPNEVVNIDSIDYFSGGLVCLSNQLAWQIAEVHLNSSAAFPAYGGRDVDVDIGWWVHWERTRGSEVQYADQAFSKALHSSPEEGLDLEVFWYFRVAARSQLCWTLVGKSHNGRLSLGGCGFAPGQNFALLSDGTIRPSHAPNRCLTASIKELASSGELGVLSFLECWTQNVTSKTTRDVQSFDIHNDGTVRPRDYTTFCIRVMFTTRKETGCKLHCMECARNASDGFDKFTVHKS